ncbi:MAG: carboxypeptidase-like regulatory domain-containing protein [Altibacter sp.]|nr:carboxypeptidase-like regulatory domain-containing protein [Altibacter sp.]
MKNSFFRHIAGILIFCVSTSVLAQIDLESKVVDFATYLPIENASIYIKNTTIGTVSNVDGKFLLVVPQEHVQDTLVVSSIGYKSFETVISEFDTSMDIFLTEDVASLDEVILVADPRPTTGNGVVQKAIERLSRNLPGTPYLQKGFLRHKERNKKEYKWLIESAITVYDSGYASGAEEHFKINVDEIRKSYDLREVDSLYTYTSYLKNHPPYIDLKSKQLRRDTIETSSLVEAIKWNDRRVNGLDNLFKGRLNFLRNATVRNALFGENLLEMHQFEVDTVLVDDGRKLYKIKISKGEDYVGLNTRNIYNEGYEPRGWLYIYWDNYAFKKIEYELVAASPAQKARSKSLFDTQINHKLVMTYLEYNDKMYPSYVYYETPKLVNVGDRSSDQQKNLEESGRSKDEQYYYTIQEIVFTKIIQDPELIFEALQTEWSQDIFTSRPYNKEFWKNYNVLLESEEEQKLIQDLSKRATLFKQ